MRTLFLFLSAIVLTSLASLAQADNGESLTPLDQGGAVYVGLAVLDVDAINSVDQSFTINLYVQFRWRDTRLAHDGPGNKRTALSDIQAPRFVLMNRQRTWSSLIDVVDIKPDGEALFRMRVWGDFSQPLRLQRFPFDSHSFEIPIMALSSENLEGYVPLLPDPQVHSRMAETFSVADWEIYDWGEKKGSEFIREAESSKNFVFQFEARRIYNHYLIKFVVPLVLIVMMSWVVFWIDPEESGSQLSVAVTVVLTLIAYHIALTNKLPDIPYLTRMDLFLFGSTLLVFGSLIEVVTTSHYASTGKLTRARRIDAFSRVLFPGAYLCIATWALNAN